MSKFSIKVVAETAYLEHWLYCRNIARYKTKNKNARIFALVKNHQDIFTLEKLCSKISNFDCGNKNGSIAGIKNLLDFLLEATFCSSLETNIALLE